jgi:hypothetical protein
MANRSFADVQALVKEVKLIAGRVSLGTAGAPTIATVTVNGVEVPDGVGFSVGGPADTSSTGTYYIELEDVYSGFLFGSASFHRINTGDELRASVKSHKVTGTGVPADDNSRRVYIEFFNSATDPAQATPSSGSEFTFLFALRNSSVAY